MDDIGQKIQKSIDDIDDMFELLEHLGLLKAPYLMKHINKIDGGHKPLAIRSYIHRANITAQLSSFHRSQIAGNRYIKKLERRPPRRRRYVR